MSTYTQRLADRLAQQQQGEVVDSGAPARLKRAGDTVGVPLPELLEWYASDLDAIEHDPEITDAVLLAYVNDYANKHRAKTTAQTTGGGVPCDW